MSREFGEDGRVTWGRMKKSDFTRQLARFTRSRRVEAADYLDQTMLSILKRWKKGEEMQWPGLDVYKADLNKAKAGPGKDK